MQSQPLPYSFYPPTNVTMCHVPYCSCVDGASSSEEGLDRAVQLLYHLLTPLRTNLCLFARVLDSALTRMGLKMGIALPQPHWGLVQFQRLGAFTQPYFGTHPHSKHQHMHYQQQIYEQYQFHAMLQDELNGIITQLQVHTLASAGADAESLQQQQLLLQQDAAMLSDCRFAIGDYFSLMNVPHCTFLIEASRAAYVLVLLNASRAFLCRLSYSMAIVLLKLDMIILFYSP